ncbi:MAG TPA: L,D-transpeptidase, partial [Pyrinomonadaceae bacterium]|nr:L,D-transpeptidase [Pyrinomonadaceae bacterium]
AFSMNQLSVLVLLILTIGCACACSKYTEANGAKGTSLSDSSNSSVRQQSLQLPLTEPRIVVLKARRQLELYSGDKLIRVYKVGLGLNPIPDKQREGDRATPEGEFYVFTKNPRSAFHLSLGISYPNSEDAERGLKDGLISRAQRDAIVRAIKRKQGPPQYTALGGLIYIHGNGARSDWTWGCVALENADIEELYRAIPVGTPVTIKP